MAISKLTVSDWLKIAGAVGIMVFGLFDWVTIDGPTGSDSGYKAFDFLFTGVIPWMLIVGTAAITVLYRAGNLRAASAPWQLIMLIATAVAVGLLLLRLAFNPVPNQEAYESAGYEFGRALGLWLSALSGVVAFAGGLLGYREPRAGTAIVDHEPPPPPFSNEPPPAPPADPT